MSSTCSYHFEQIVGYCINCKSYACAICLSDHLEHLTGIVVLKNLTDKIDNFYIQLSKMRSDNDQTIKQAYHQIQQYRNKCNQHFAKMQSTIDRQEKEYRSKSSIEKYIKCLGFLKSKQYQQVQPADFESLVQLLITRQPADLKINYDKQVLKLQDTIASCKTDLSKIDNDIIGTQKSGLRQRSAQGFLEAQKQFDLQNYRGAAQLFTMQLDDLIAKEVLVPYGKYVDKHFQSYRRIQDPQGVAKLAWRMIGIEPNRNTNYFNLGIAQANCGKYNLALQSFDMAKKMGFNRPEVFATSADLYEKLKMNDKAIEQYSKAIELDPVNTILQVKRTTLQKSMIPVVQPQVASKPMAKPPAKPLAKPYANLQEPFSELDLSMVDHNIQIDFPAPQPANNNIKPPNNYNGGVPTLTPQSNLSHSIYQKSPSVVVRPHGVKNPFQPSQPSSPRFTINADQQPPHEIPLIIPFLPPNHSPSFGSRSPAGTMTAVNYTSNLPYDHGSDLVILFNQANQYEKAKNYAKAIEGYNRVITIRPSDANAFFNRARCQYMLKNFAEAGSSADRAITLNPKNPQFYQLRGLIMSEAQPHSPQILQIIDKGLQLEPRNAALLFQKGNYLAQTKQYSSAFECFKLAAKQQPNNPQLWFEQGLLLEKLNRSSEALQCIDVAQKISPDKRYSQAKTRIQSGIRKQKSRCL